MERGPQRTKQGVRSAESDGYKGQAMIQAFRAVESNDYGMYMLDKELAGRTYAAPSPLASAE